MKFSCSLDYSSYQKKSSGQRMCKSTVMFYSWPHSSTSRLCIDARHAYIMRLWMPHLQISDGKAHVTSILICVPTGIPMSNWACQWLFQSAFELLNYRSNARSFGLFAAMAAVKYGFLCAEFQQVHGSSCRAAIQITWPFNSFVISSRSALEKSSYNFNAVDRI